MAAESGEIKFEVLAEIAAGTTARVDLCRATAPEAKAGQLLAVKRLHSHIAEDQQFADMFFDEVWLTAALRSPNVVQVVGWGTDEEGTYLAVELIQGVSLARLMKTVFDTGEVFSERMVVFMGSCLCRGLAAAHNLESREGELLGLVHRDLTPGNILCGFNGALKIADFGLAKAKQRVTRTLTGLLKGSPQYMSPEQTEGKPIDGRADLFSLGIVLYELFTGRRPWSGKTEMQVMHVKHSEPPRNLAELRPKIDKELVAVVMQCLEKDPDRRFARAEDVGARLDHWLKTHGYTEGNPEALGRFVRRNSMRQMRWFERAVKGDLSPMPDSMRPSARSSNRRQSMRLPRMGPLTGSVAASALIGSSKPRVRAQSRKPLDSESTDVTDADAKVAELHARLESRDNLVEDSSDESTGQGPWAEEVPTLVKKDPDGPISGLPVASAAIHDEDSDQRTTAIKGARKRTAPTTPVGRRIGVPVVSDLESEDEAPTVPVIGKRADVVAAALRQASAQPSRKPGSVAPPDPAVPPPPVSSAAGPNGSSVSAAISSAPGAPASGGSIPSSVPPRYRPDQVTEQLLLAEADRLALDAVRRNDESKQAAAEAVRRATVAKITGEAARLAAEAVRLATTAGLAQAAKQLERVHALESSLDRVGTGDEVASSTSGSAAAPSHAPPSHVPASTAPPSATTQPSPGQGLSVPSVRPEVESRPSLSPPDPGLALSGEFGQPTGLDAFRSKLRPTVFGMPTVLALGLAVSGIVALIVVLLLLAF